MLPPMIYRIYNPGLTGLDNENAYLLMCKEALPAGFLGLMLGGMIFATASSLNGTLNISAGVFTNDIYKRLHPAASDKSLINIARLSTVFFGILAIVIAMLVKSMGGIVNVVISVAALTGVPLYLPVIWSMFSKRQTGKTLISVTLISLAINLFFKFVSPTVLGLTLSRAQEMMLGALSPIILLTLIEIYLMIKGYERKTTIPSHENIEEQATEVQDRDLNKYTNKVLGISVSVAGAAVILLGALAPSDKLVPISVGLLVSIIGISLIRKSR